jgi:hypothetical protein
MKNMLGGGAIIGSGESKSREIWGATPDYVFVS